MKGHGGKFERKQEEAIAALLTQRNIEEAAKAAGIAANTLLSWMKVPEFQKSYREARRAAFGQAIARLQQGTSAAATTLLKTMIDPATPRPSKCEQQKQSLITQPRPSRSRTSKHAWPLWKLLRP